jgi:hypothetical protein
MARSGPPQDHPDHDRGGWDAPPQEFREVQRQGFHDGIEAARRDFQDRRPENMEMVEVFRHPPVRPEARDEYRDGFRRGYSMAFAHFREGTGAPPMPMMQAPPPQDHPDHDRGGWDAPPQEFRDMQRQGFHDGIEAAKRDFENSRPPDVERKRQFREPPVPPPARDDYRDGFRRGYESAFTHLREDHDHH